MIDALIAWLTAAGAQLDEVDVRERGDGRGVFARRALAAGTVVVQVPRPRLITRELVAASPIARQLRDAAVELSSPQVVLAAWLLAEDRVPDSPWRPYLDTLPRDPRAFPLSAPPDELALLDGTRAGALLGELRTALVLDHLALDAGCDALRGLGRDALIWARLTIGARVYGVTIDGVETSVLVPFADLFNHARDPHATWTYDHRVAAFAVTTVRAVAAGEELTISYGAKSNPRLLALYGFSLDDNPDDEAELWVPAPFLVPRDPDHAASRELLDALRAHHPGRALGPALADAARAALAILPPDDDDARLAGAGLSPLARSFLQARRGERRVLRAWLAHAATL